MASPKGQAPVGYRDERRHRLSGGWSGRVRQGRRATRTCPRRICERVAGQSASPGGLPPTIEAVATRTSSRNRTRGGDPGELPRGRRFSTRGDESKNIAGSRAARPHWTSRSSASDPPPVPGGIRRDRSERMTAQIQCSQPGSCADATEQDRIRELAPWGTPRNHQESPLLDTPLRRWPHILPDSSIALPSVRAGQELAPANSSEDLRCWPAASAGKLTA